MTHHQCISDVTSDTIVSIGVLTTGPRLQNAYNDTFLQPNYYTYSNSDHGCVLDVTSQAICKLGHLVASQHRPTVDARAAQSRLSDRRRGRLAKVPAELYSACPPFRPLPYLFSANDFP
jgi:hypothetical protein